MKISDPLMAQFKLSLLSYSFRRMKRQSKLLLKAINFQTANIKSPPPYAGNGFSSPHETWEYIKAISSVIVGEALKCKRGDKHKTCRASERTHVIMLWCNVSWTLRSPAAIVVRNLRPHCSVSFLIHMRGMLLPHFNNQTMREIENLFECLHI